MRSFRRFFAPPVILHIVGPPIRYLYLSCKGVWLFFSRFKTDIRRPETASGQIRVSDAQVSKRQVTVAGRLRPILVGRFFLWWSICIVCHVVYLGAFCECVSLLFSMFGEMPKWTKLPQAMQVFEIVVGGRHSQFSPHFCSLSFSAARPVCMIHQVISQPRYKSYCNQELIVSGSTDNLLTRVSSTKSVFALISFASSTFRLCP